MIKSAVLSLFAAVVLQASCTSERRHDATDDVAQPGARTSLPGTSRTTNVAPAPAGGESKVVALPTDHAVRDDVREKPSEPDGVLPLNTGVYVLEDSGCSAPANAAVRFYDGRGISGSATHSCRTQIRSRRGDTYSVDQSCIDTPSGDGPRTSESQTVSVHDAQTFTLSTKDDSARFRLCPAGEVPQYLRERMAQSGTGDGGD